MGDARLTTYYYTFNADQGDVFINVVTANLNGDIDIFAADGLRPLTKIVVYADSSQNETGRVVYLRKPEKLILRIEGRPPNDDPATYRIKFAGSFTPVTTVAETEEPKLPEIKRENQGDVIVNSVGTIVGVKPKPTPSPKVVAAEKEEPQEIAKSESENEQVVSQTKPAENEIKEAKPSEIEEAPQRKPLVVITTDELADKPEENEESRKDETEKSVSAEAEITKTDEASIKTDVAEIAKPTETERKITELTPEMKKLEKIRLRVVLKTGDKFERPMSEIFSVNVDRGQLTVITRDGKIERFSIFDVAKMTIE